MLLGRRGRSRAATVADGAWEDEMRLLARKLSQHRDRPRHRFLGSQGLNYGWSNIFVNLCCSRIGASFDVAVALCQTMLSRLAPKTSVFLSVFKGACVNLCCCQPCKQKSPKGLFCFYGLFDRAALRKHSKVACAPASTADQSQAPACCSSSCRKLGQNGVALP